jgi:hypothetical protein
MLRAAPSLVCFEVDGCVLVFTGVERGKEFPAALNRESRWTVKLYWAIGIPHGKAFRLSCVGSSLIQLELVIQCVAGMLFP